MAKSTPAKPVVTPTAEEAKPVEKKYTDKVYARLPLHAEVVVQVGPRERMQKNKVVTVEEAKNVIYTKAGYEAMDRDDDGETTHCLTKLLGIPEYKTVEDPTTVDGIRKEFDVLYFAETEDDDTDEEEPQA